MAPTLLLGSALGLVVAGLYAYLGAEHARRRQGAASAAFATFWWGIGIHAALESSWAIALAFAPIPLAASVVVLLLKILTGVAAFAGLVTYLLVVYGGNARVAPWVAAFYTAVYAFVVYAYMSRVPVGQELRTWYAGLLYEHPEGLLHQIVALLLFLPPLLATLGYALLLRYAKDRAQRRRMIATVAGFVVFFGGFLLGWVHESWMWWGLVERMLAIGASLAILATLETPQRDAERAELALSAQG